MNRNNELNNIHEQTQKHECNKSYPYWWRLFVSSKGLFPSKQEPSDPVKYLEFTIELATQILAFRKNGKILITVPTITESSNKSTMSELKTRNDKSVDCFKTKLRLTKAQTQAIM